MIVVVDRLGAGQLGPYGNAWVDTAALNRFAVESTVFDFYLADTTDFNRAYRSLWSGMHALCEGAHATPLPAIVRRLGVAATLLTDSTSLTEHALAGEFEDVVVPPVASAPALSVEETHFARLFQAAEQWLAEARSPFLLWIHSQGMQGEWDAPTEFVAPLIDDDDDAAEQSRARHAAQVELLDVCLDTFFKACDAAEWNAETLVAATSLRGQPRREDNASADKRLDSQSIQLPLLIRYGASQEALIRSQKLAQPPDLFATIADWLGAETESPIWGRSLRDVQNAPDFDRACSVDADCRALRTKDWHYIRCPDEPAKLFVKPDDRWESNEISSRCEQETLALEAALDDFEQCARRVDREARKPLDDFEQSDQ